MDEAAQTNHAGGLHLCGSVRDALTFDGPFRFDEAVAAAFSDMLARSVPDYAGMRGWCNWLAGRLCGVGPVVDLGCSLGGASQSLPGVIGIDNSQAMVNRYEGASICWDLEEGLPKLPPAQLGLAVLVLMFLTPRARERILWTLDARYLIVVEKVAPVWPLAASLLRQRLIEHKLGQGYSWRQILTKEQSLAGSLRALPAAETERMLAAAGWRFECFWRCGLFAGWLCERQESR